MVTYTKTLTQKVVNPTDIAGNAEEEEELAVIARDVDCLLNVTATG